MVHNSSLRIVKGNSLRAQKPLSLEADMCRHIIICYSATLFWTGLSRDCWTFTKSEKKLTAARIPAAFRLGNQASALETSFISIHS